MKTGLLRIIAVRSIHSKQNYSFQNEKHHFKMKCLSII